MKLRHANLLKVAIKQACHQYPAEVGPRDIVAVNDQYSVEIDNVDLLLENYCDKFEPMNEEDLETCVMHYVAEAKYSKYNQKQKHPYLHGNPQLILPPTCKMLYAKHILTFWGKAHPDNPPVEQFLPKR